MSKSVPVADLYLVIKEKLRTGGTVTLMASGVSMLPMLKHQRDTIILGPVLEKLPVNDVILYRRKSGQLVLHRIVGLETNGDYILCGDNQFYLEHHIEHSQVVGRLLEFVRRGRRIPCTSEWYRAYVCYLPVLRLIKFLFFTFRTNASVIKRWMCRRKFGRR